MESKFRLTEQDVARVARRTVAAMRPLLEAAAACDGPDETRRCLDQLAAHVAILAEACASVGGEGARDESEDHKVVEITRLERSRAALRELVGADLIDQLGVTPPFAHPSAGSFRPGDAAAGHAERPRLTPQEQRILTLVGQGCTNRQIAGELYLAEKTVKNYVSNMLRKLGMERRTQAAIYASSLERNGGPASDSPRTA